MSTVETPNIGTWTEGLGIKKTSVEKYWEESWIFEEISCPSNSSENSQNNDNRNLDMAKKKKL